MYIVYRLIQIHALMSAVHLSYAAIKSVFAFDSHVYAFMHEMGESEVILFYSTADDSNALLKVQMDCTICECIHASPSSQ